MRYLLLALVTLSGCATLTGQGLKSEYCGKVDTLEVYRREYTSISCSEAVSVTQQAYDLLWEKAAGPLSQPWRVEYMWGNINIEGALAHTDPFDHTILVQAQYPASIFHELLHAYMFETETGGSDHHTTMCHNKEWQHLENEFGVTRYCQWIH